MKIVQSFWSKNQSLSHSNFGWHDPTSHLLGWILSSNLLKKLYKKVELVTDETGYEVLIKKLQLPFSTTKVIFQDVKDYPENFWAIAKLKAFEIQREPFIHVDGDVFVWKKFSKRLESSPILAQNLEITTDYTRKFWDSFHHNLKYIPEELLAYHEGKSDFSCNLGIVGGCDVEFFKNFTHKAWDFIHQNRLRWHKINLEAFNLFFEQILFYQMSKRENKEIEFLLPNKIKDNEYKGFGDFHKIKVETNYLHLLGHYKRDENICKSLKNYVLNHYPTYFKSLLEFLGTNCSLIYPLGYDFSVESNESFKRELLEVLKKKGIENDFNTHILARDLLSVDFTLQFNLNVLQENDFWLTKYPFKKSKQGNGSTIIRIEELDKSKHFIEIDELDEFILELITNTILYSNLKKAFLDHISGIEYHQNIELTIKFFNSRLLFFVSNRMIAVV